MERPLTRILAAATIGVASLTSAALCCIGCSIRAWNRQGQSEDVLTFLMAGGTYLSLALGVAAAVLLFTSSKRSD